jgi:hypothetical protein
VASADGLTSIHLDCGDGYPVDAIVDLQTLTDIQDVVNDMTLYPAGMTCLLSTAVVTDPLATPSTDPIFLGSGRYVAPAQADTQNPTGAGFCFYNFAVSAHMKNGQPAEGTSNVTETTQAPDGAVCPSSGGHITADIQCLNATPASMNSPATADASGPIKNATDDFAYLEPTSTSVSGMRTHGSSGTADSNPPATISHDTYKDVVPPCAAQSGAYPLMNGKVKIKTT